MRGLFILGLGAVVALGWPILAFAGEDLPQDTSEAQKAPQFVRAGDVAPFSGMLMPLSVAATVTAKVEGCEKRIEVARNEAREVADVELGYLANLRENDRQAHELQTKMLENAISQAEPAWWEHPAVWFLAGIGATIAIFAGSVSILDAMRPIGADSR